MLSTIPGKISSQIFEALKQDEEIKIDRRLHTIRKISICEKLLHARDKDYFFQLKIDIAQYLIPFLREFSKNAEAQYIKPAQAEKHELIKISVLLLKKVSPLYKGSHPVLDVFSKCYFASQLCISEETLDKNAGFEFFAKTNYLDRYLIEYEHRLEVSHRDKTTLFLQTEHGKQKWEDIKEDRSLIDEEGRLKGRYGYYGVQVEGYNNWEDLPLFKIENPESWGKKYVLEICVNCIDWPRESRDHSWIRLKKPTGEIYSVGLSSSMEITNCSSFWKRVCCTTKGRLNSPDYVEFWPQKNYLIQPFVINEDTFEEIKSSIENSHKQGLSFQIALNNCTTFCSKYIAPRAGIYDLSSRKRYTSVLFPMLKGFINEKIAQTLPRTIVCLLEKNSEKIKQIYLIAKKINPVVFLQLSRLSYIYHKKINFILGSACQPLFYLAEKSFACVLNILPLMLGASRIDDSLKAEEVNNLEPLFNSWNDLFDLKKSEFAHPYFLGQVIKSKLQ